MRPAATAAVQIRVVVRLVSRRALVYIFTFKSLFSFCGTTCLFPRAFPYLFYIVFFFFFFFLYSLLTSECLCRVRVGLLLDTTPYIINNDLFCCILMNYYLHISSSFLLRRPSIGAWSVRRSNSQSPVSKKSTRYFVRRVFEQGRSGADGAFESRRRQELRARSVFLRSRGRGAGEQL